MIRAATSDDLPALLEMGELMLAESPHFAAVPLSRERLGESLLALLGTPDALVALAEVDGIPAGVMVAFAAPHWASEIVEVSEIALFVHLAYRRSGIAAALIERFKEFACERGAGLVRAGASAGICDDAVVRLYERAGFKPCGACLQL
jgi:GNAT superfamily N-acetyltransferase